MCCVPLEPIDVGSDSGSVLCLMVLRSTAESGEEELPQNYQHSSLEEKSGTPSLEMVNCPILAGTPEIAAASGYVLGTLTHETKKGFACFQAGHERVTFEKSLCVLFGCSRCCGN